MVNNQILQSDEVLILLFILGLVAVILPSMILMIEIFFRYSFIDFFDYSIPKAARSNINPFAFSDSKESNFFLDIVTFSFHRITASRNIMERVEYFFYNCHRV